MEDVFSLTGIIAEYDPFHNGHRYLIGQARKNGASHIIAVMGGSFMQRGECAVLPKHERAEAAVRAGADLVAELPQVFACASAQRFAYGAVETLKACGCVDTLCFGSECADVKSIENAAKALENIDISKYTAMGYSYPRAVRAALEENGKTDLAEIFSSPNDTLAAEYLRAANGAFKPLAVRRTVSHDDEAANENFISASAIRRMLLSGSDKYNEYIPETTAGIIRRCKEKGLCPASIKNNERGIMAILRSMSSDDFARLPDVSEGLENRIVRAVRENNTIEDILAEIKCKRYTYARLSRIISCAYLGITKDDIGKKPQYIRVLAFNDKGTEILRKMKKTASLPVVMRSKDIANLNEEARRMIDIDLRASDLLGLCTPEIRKCGIDHYVGAIRV